MIERPKSIAICFVDGVKDTSMRQVKILEEEGIYDDFQVEWHFRSDKASVPYTSFSQIINEAVVETSLEFMIFFNPRTTPTREGINRIINDLCNGFAWSSVCAYGFFGTTKELFRKIGLMDERFIGGNYEDNDFTMRMKQANLAINFRFETDKYPWEEPVLHQLSGITKTKFKTKWHKTHDGVYYRTDLFKEDKKLPPYILNAPREDISKSWKSWGESEWDGYGKVYPEADEALISNSIIESSATRHNIIIRLFPDGDNNFRFGFDIEDGVETELHMVLTSGSVGSERRVYDKDFVLDSNFYKSQPLTIGNYDIRFFHNGKLILNNSFYQFPSTRTYELGINLYHFGPYIEQ